MRKKIINKEFVLKIILPTLLVFALFTILIFAIIIPSIKTYMLDGKREMIRELTNSVWSVLDELDKQVSDSSITLNEAQLQAVANIKNMRYGEERKDYFWITDMRPFMIMHPYRGDLNGADLSNYQDATGKKMFVEFVKAVEANGEDYVDYMWQWKDDSTRTVPKLSFVKGFKKWRWVIGTGIYIEDVYVEISSLTNSLVYISISILFILGLSLFFISRQSLLIESKRHTAELGLKESEAKYRALVEASTDGLIMMLDGYYIYSNQAILKMLGYDLKEDNDINLNTILCNHDDKQRSGSVYFNRLTNGLTPQDQFPAQLKKKNGALIDVILYASKITLGEKSGYSIIVKDVSAHKQIKEELDLNREKFQTLANNIKIGVFRSSLAANGKIVEANKSTANILGYSKASEVLSLNLFDFFLSRADKKGFLKKLNDEGAVKNQIIRIKSKDGSTFVVSIAAAPVKDTEDRPEYFDGTIEDISHKIKIEEERENLIIELQTSLRFLNQPIKHFVKHFVTCTMRQPIYQVAKLMTREKFSAALIRTEKGEYAGIITDQDIRKRVVSQQYDLGKPIFEVMSSPLITISSNSPVFEAFILMNERATRHLAVKNRDDEIIGVISSEELISVHRNSTTYLLKEIDKAETVAELIVVHDRLPILVKALIDSGARSRIISHLTTSIFENITAKLILFAINKLGKPPVEFSFVALGSAGREEQTLISDQDNAIIYMDVPMEKEEAAHQYFHSLGTKVCDWLNDCGYVYCQGEAMAKNPKWSKPLSKWKEYFHGWITNADQQDLIDLSIFFDFRSVYGNDNLTDQLRKHVFKSAEGQAGFYQHLTMNSLLHKPPVGLLGKIVVESKGAHQETFDIKAAMTPVSDFARIYALKHKVNQANTLERLDGILDKGIINKTTYEELKQAYNYLMQLRFKHQSEQIVNEQTADNHINPTTMTQIEQKTLKNIFTQILSIQKKLSYDFSGEAL